MNQFNRPAWDKTEEMKIEVTEQYNILLKEVYNGVILETNAGESIVLCMRDTGFEIQYEGRKYLTKQGRIVLESHTQQRNSAKLFLESKGIKDTLFDETQQNGWRKKGLSDLLIEYNKLTQTK